MGVPKDQLFDSAYANKHVSDVRVVVSKGTKTVSIEEWDECQSTIFSLRQQVTELQAENIELKEENKQLRIENTRLKEENTTLKSRIARLEEDVASQARAIEHLTERLDAEKDDRKREKEEWMRERQYLKDTIEQLSKRLEVKVGGDLRYADVRGCCRLLLQWSSLHLQTDCGCDCGGNSGASLGGSMVD
jgi:predicted nuclease with TOPRIM domain